MLGAETYIDTVVDEYPEEDQEELRAHIQQLIHREKRYLLGQVQMLFSSYHCCSTLQGLRADIDALFLSDLTILPEAQALITHTTA